MKNLNKALALLVVIAMMISSVAFAATFSDVAADSAYAEAVNVGVSLNLFKGYEDGTFKPEGDITRAEFAAIVVRMLGQEAQADGSKGSTSFTDVAADHWAAGYINIATQRGIINGYGDGKFGPEDKVLYEQAIKMVVVALGYAPSIGTAGYPVGYLTKAGELGVTSGVKGENGVAANRGIVAQIVLNAVDVPLMQQTGYGTFVDYVIQDGYGDTTRKTMLSEYLGVVKLQVTVDSSSLLESGNKNDETVDVTILNNYKTKYGEIGDEFETGLYAGKINVGTTELSSLVGSKAIIYVAYDENSSDDPIAVYAAKDTSKTYEVTISTDNLDSADLDGNVLTLSYYANATDKKPETVTIKVGPTLENLYVNGGSPKAITAASDLVSVVNNDSIPAFYGEVTLAKLVNTNSEDYDTVYVKDYTDLVVDTVNKNTMKVTAKNDTKNISFSTTDTSITSNLFDDKGAKMEWTDLKEWDVLSVQIAEGNNKTVYTARLVKNSITGKITGVIDDTSKQTVKYEIGGKEYQIDTEGMALSDLYLGDEGTFYLDQLGRIAWYDTTTTTNGNYAYIENIVATTGLTSQPEMKVFNAKGEFQTLKVATTVKIDGIGNLKSDLMFDAAGVNAIPLTKTMTQTDYDAIVARYGAGNLDFAAGTVTVDAVVPGDFITFKSNSNNEVTEIDRATSVTNTTDVKGQFIQYGTGVQATTSYTEASQSFNATAGRVYITDKTVIMVAAPDATTGDISTNDDNYELFNIASIEDDQVFNNVSFYNVDENKNVGAILVNSDPVIEASTSGFLAVSGYSETTNAEGDSNYTVKGLKDGVAESLATATDVEAPASGSVVLASKNAKGEVKDFRTLATISGKEIDVTVPLTTIDGKQVQNPANKNLYYFGKVKEIRGRNVTLFAATDDAQSTDSYGLDIATLAATNVYVYDMRVSSASKRLSVEDINYVDARLAEANDVVAGKVALGDTLYEDDGLAISSMSIFAREYEGKVVDVMLYIFN